MCHISSILFFSGFGWVGIYEEFHFCCWTRVSVCFQHTINKEVGLVQAQFLRENQGIGSAAECGSPRQWLFGFSEAHGFSGSRSFVLVFLCRKQFSNQPDSLASNSMEKESSHSANLTQLLNMAHWNSRFTVIYDGDFRKKSIAMLVYQDEVGGIALVPGGLAAQATRII